jgi:hypothetical protein
MPTGESATPVPTGEVASPAPTFEISTTPIPGETLAESDKFWNEWASEPYVGLVFQAKSLDDNVRLADLVVRGHITDIYVGEYWQWENISESPPTPLVYVSVAISEVLQGTPVSRVPGFVEVTLGPGTTERVDDLRARLPQHDNIWFLKYDLALRPRPSINNTEIAPSSYLPSNDLQGVLREVGGELRVIKPEWYDENPYLGPNHFPLPLQGTSFDRLVDDVRAIGETMPDPTPVASP